MNVSMIKTPMYIVYAMINRLRFSEAFSSYMEIKLANEPLSEQIM